MDSEGLVQGVLVIPTETTQRVLGTKRQQVLQVLSDSLGSSESADDLLALAVRTFETVGDDGTTLCFCRAMAARQGRDTGTQVARRAAQHPGVPKAGHAQQNPNQGRLPASACAVFLRALWAVASYVVRWLQAVRSALQRQCASIKARTG